MRVAGFTAISALSVKENAELFKSTTSDMYGGSAKLAAGFRRAVGQVQSGQRLEFFKPTQDAVFGELDDDAEDFAVGVTVPKTIGTGGGSVVVQMYVWDRGDRREARLRSPHTMGSTNATYKALGVLADAYRAADPNAVITED
jgi:hypothetical protein